MRSPTPSGNAPLWLLLALGAALHMGIVAFVTADPRRGSNWGDATTFQDWVAVAAEDGVLTAYSNPRFGYDYLPLYLGVVKAVATACRGTGRLEPFARLYDTGIESPVVGVSLRASMVALNLATGALLFHFARRLYGPGPAPLWVAAAWVLNPGIALATDVFAYQDALHTLLLVGAAFAIALDRRGAAGAATALALLTKPQAAAFLVPFGVVLWKRGGKRGIAGVSSGAGVAAAAVLAPFAAAGELPGVVRGYVAVPSIHTWLSGCAHNLWWALFPASDADSFPSDRAVLVLGLNGLTLGLLLLVTFAVLVVRRLARGASDLDMVHLSAYFAFVFFMVVTQLHENHLYAAFPFLALAAPSSRLRQGILAALTVTFAANVLLALSWIYTGGDSVLEVGGVRLTVMNSVVNLGVLALWTPHALRAGSSAA